MTKKEAIALFGTARKPGTPRKLAEAMGITTQAVSQWPDVLTDRIADRVRGRRKRTKPNAQEEK